MAWSDAARKAAADIRHAHALFRQHGSPDRYRNMYHTGNVGGKIVDTSRAGLAKTIRQARSTGRLPVKAVALAGIARQSTEYRNARRILARFKNPGG